MSTKFTRQATKGPPPPPLTVLLQTASEWVSHSLLTILRGRGHTYLTPSHIMLLGNLDCGTTYASAAAARLGISRQAVYRTVRELEEMDILRLENATDRRNQKEIVMTDAGKALANDARAALAEIEATLADRIGAESSRALRQALESGWGETLG